MLWDFKGQQAIDMGNINNFNVDEKSVGVLLRKARGSLSIRKISDELCISSYLLKALEQGRSNVFASNCYATGFLKNYSEYLGLDTAEIIRKYKIEFNHYVEKSDSLKSIESSFCIGNDSVSKFLVSRMFSYLGVVLLLGAGAWFFVSKTGMLAEETYSKLNLQSNFQLLESKTSSDGVKIVKEKENFSFIQTAKAKLPTKTLVQGQVKVKAKVNSWVRIMGKNNEVFFDRILYAGEEVQIPYLKDMVMMTSNAGALRISFGDNEGHIFGRKGQIIEGITLEKKE